MAPTRKLFKDFLKQQLRFEDEYMIMIDSREILMHEGHPHDKYYEYMSSATAELIMETFKKT